LLILLSLSAGSVLLPPAGWKTAAALAVAAAKAGLIAAFFMKLKQASRPPSGFLPPPASFGCPSLLF